MESNDLKIEIEKIKERNKKVEAEKAWETSFVRKVSIAIFTYLFMCLFMWSIGVTNIFVNALVPTFGYLLSTLSMSFVKRFWIKELNK